MNSTEQWAIWLAEADSDRALAPPDYDDAAADALVREVSRRLRDAVAPYVVRPGSSALYQDSTGLAEIRITVPDDSGQFPRAPTWVVLTHFGNLATVQECSDAKLLARIVAELEAAGLHYIPYDYLHRTIYQGRCKELFGRSMANRFFSLATEFNEN